MTQQARMNCPSVFRQSMPHGLLVPSAKTSNFFVLGWKRQTPPLIFTGDCASPNPPAPFPKAEGGADFSPSPLRGGGWGEGLTAGEGFAEVTSLCVKMPCNP